MEFVVVKKGLEEGQFVLIDVRNPDEVASMGKIPGMNCNSRPAMPSLLTC